MAPKRKTKKDREKNASNIEIGQKIYIWTIIELAETFFFFLSETPMSRIQRLQWKKQKFVLKPKWRWTMGQLKPAK